MFTIDETSNKDYYIIFKDGVEHFRVNKLNKLKDVINQFKIDVIKLEKE